MRSSLQPVGRNLHAPTHPFCPLRRCGSPAPMGRAGRECSPGPAHQCVAPATVEGPAIRAPCCAAACDVVAQPQCRHARVGSLTSYTSTCICVAHCSREPQLAALLGSIYSPPLNAWASSPLPPSSPPHAALQCTSPPQILPDGSDRRLLLFALPPLPPSPSIHHQPTFQSALPSTGSVLHFLVPCAPRTPLLSSEPQQPIALAAEPSRGPSPAAHEYTLLPWRDAESTEAGVLLYSPWHRRGPLCLAHCPAILIPTERAPSPSTPSRQRPHGA